ncbi:IS3 family transposase [Hujiaoplasma nucleasis]|uniref:IS3 family transposase n=1 Tax=Hujiaoplasma nucleasis TaxID=2725268 RepID=A0A7L6N619_9MOLU|nr:IS3 family transposase [Hujiaoplasma nucleasis]
MGNLKYIINLYKKHGKKVFDHNKIKTYKRDTKLLAIARVENGESIRSVALDLGLTDPTILGDWLKLYRTKGEAAVKDTYSRKGYLTKDKRAKAIVDQTLLEENERLKAEIEYLKKSRSLTKKLEGVTSKEKAEIVTSLRTKFKLSDLLEVAQMASSVYYYHTSEYKKKANKYKDIEKEIDYLYLKKHKKRIGYHRVYIELKKMNYVIGKNKVLEIMRHKGYTKKKVKKWRKYNSYAGDLGFTKPNQMNQDFSTLKPYQKAGTDITMFRTERGPVYLSPIIDFDSREVLSYVAGTNAKMDKITKMLELLKKHHSNRVKGMMIQSDQGIQYQNSRYQTKLEELGIIQSMSRKGNCLDNSPTENFFGRMKVEMWYGHEKEYKSPKALIKAIDEYINYYNNTRLVTKHKMSPIEYRNNMI